jgi:hypothetical protein
LPSAGFKQGPTLALLQRAPNDASQD